MSQNKPNINNALRLLIATIVFITVCMLMYLAGAFVYNDFNIVNWGMNGRFFVVTFSFCFGLPSSLLVYFDDF